MKKLLALLLLMTALLFTGFTDNPYSISAPAYTKKAPNRRVVSVVSPTILYTENFESYNVTDAMVDNGWTWYQYLAEVGAFLVATGKYGECKVTFGNWAGGFELDEGTAWTNYRVEFDVISYVGARWIFAFRSSVSGAYWIQCIPGSTILRLYTGTRVFLVSQTQIKDWDAQCPAAPHTTCKIEVNGTSIKVWVNGIYVGEHTDASFSAGSINISTYQAGWEIDNIVITDLGG